jgi:hypothetical protein
VAAAQRMRVGSGATLSPEENEKHEHPCAVKIWMPDYRARLLWTTNPPLPLRALKVFNKIL